MTFWDKLDRFPPVLVRLLAREGGEALTDRQIAVTSGLPLAEVLRLGHLTSWDDVTAHVMRRFLIGCEVDLEDRATFRNLNRYMKDPKFDHLRRHKSWPQFKTMLALYAETLR